MRANERKGARPWTKMMMLGPWSDMYETVNLDGMVGKDEEEKAGYEG
jgi:hypothetical protein